MEQGTNTHLLLATKLAVPTTYLKSIISRTRLHELLNAGIQRPLTLLTAPAGFGKTALLSEWIKQYKPQAAWVSLEQNDNEIERFWRYIISAMNQLHPAIAEQLDIWQPSFQPPHIELLLTALINGLLTLPHEIVLVLDDYHTITSSTIHHSLLFLIEHLPPQLHLIIATRNNPPFSLSRLRVQGKLTEIKTYDLRFTTEESTDFLLQGMKLALTREDVEELHQRTEGWIAALQLAAISLQGHDDPRAITKFIRTFSGTNRDILSYLTDEVLVRLPEEVQTFLLQTAILESMNASLCNAVTEQTNGQTMLEWLDQANLFIDIIDNQTFSYRYYYLFADLLLHRLQQKEPSLQPELHLRASHWYEKHNFVVEAVKHAMGAEDSERAADLIDQHAWTLLQCGEGRSLEIWLQQIPESAFATRPALIYLHAWTFLLEGQTKAYEQALHSAEQNWLNPHNAAWLSHICAMRTLVALLCADRAQAFTYAQQTLILAPEEDLRLRGGALIALGAAYLLAGNLTQARLTLTEGYMLAKKSLHVLAILAAKTCFSTIQLWQGDLHAIAQTFKQIQLDPDEKLPIWYSIFVHTRLGQIYYEWDNIASALEHWQEAMQTVKQHEHESFATAERYILAARIASIQGEQDQIMLWLDQAEQSSQRFGRNPLYLAQITALRVQYLLEQHNLTTALHWEKHYNPTDEEMRSPPIKEACYMLQARLAISQENPGKAITLLEEVCHTAREQGRIGNAIALLALLTIAQYAEGNTQLTIQTLELALTLAQKGTYIRTFIDEGPIMGVLLTEFYSRYQRRATSEQQTISPHYLYTLLKACGQEIHPVSCIMPHTFADTLIEKLSEREQSVLSLIAEGLSNQEIAQKLVVTVSTIKTHLNNIYAKLHVHTRLQAVTRAYDIGILRRSELDTESLTSPHSHEKV